MAIDQRDWYIRALRRRTRYNERAKFRINLGAQERRQAWAGFWQRAACIAALIMVAGYIARHLLR